MASDTTDTPANVGIPGETLGGTRAADRRRKRLLIGIAIAVVVIIAAVVGIIIGVSQRSGTLNCNNSRVVPGAVALPRICV